MQIFCTNVRFGCFYYVHVTRKSCWNYVCTQNTRVLRWWNWRQVVDFSVSLFKMDNRFFMKIPGRSVSWTTFTDVFEKHFWLVIVGMIIILSLAFYIESSCIKDGIKVDLPTSGVNFINVLRTAFALVDPESVKNTFKSSVSFYTFGIYEHKSCT